MDKYICILFAAQIVIVSGIADYVHTYMYMVIAKTCVIMTRHDDNFLHWKIRIKIKLCDIIDNISTIICSKGQLEMEFYKPFTIDLIHPVEIKYIVYRLNGFTW